MYMNVFSWKTLNVFVRKDVFLSGQFWGQGKAWIGTDGVTGRCHHVIRTWLTLCLFCYIRGSTCNFI